MTLATPKKLHPSHHQRTGRHQHRHKRFHKTYWPYLPLVMIVGLGLLLNSLWPAYRSILGYATEMSVSQLLVETNQERVENGLGKLSINSQLTSAAEAKASDMAAKDYWSHNTPSGETPWTFILAAGYDYKTAGENLAYGFDSSASTVTAWMNSPGHRANILNSSYIEVGFGIININDYQDSGNQTLVVAMYGSPQVATSPAPEPSSPPAESQPEPAPQLAVNQPQPQPKAEAEEVKPQNTPKKSSQPAQRADTLTPNTVSEPKEATISRIQLVANGKAAWGLSFTLIVLSVALGLLLVRHGLAWHKFLVRGERFILRHPVFDFAAVSIVMIGVILSNTAGTVL